MTFYNKYVINENIVILIGIRTFFFKNHVTLNKNNKNVFK